MANHVDYWNANTQLFVYVLLNSVIKLSKKLYEASNKITDVDCVRYEFQSRISRCLFMSITACRPDYIIHSNGLMLADNGTQYSTDIWGVSYHIFI